MKRFVATLFLSVATFALASTPSDHIVRITGYETGHTAAVGAIQQTLDANVIVPIVKDLDGKKGRAVIWVKGSADRTGKSSSNDGYGTERAREAKAYLDEQLYRAKVDAIITIRTLGDNEDSRMIVVDWSIELPAQIVPQQQKKAKNLPMLALGAFVLAMLAAIFAFRRRRKSIKTKIETTVETQILSFRVNRKKYVATAEVRGGVYQLPIPYDPEGTKPLIRRDRRNAVQALKSKLLDPDPRVQAFVQLAFKNGTIREIPDKESHYVH